MLFTPLRVGGVELKNRVVLSPLSQYAAVDGHPNETHMITLAQCAVGGVSLVMTESTAVVPEGRMTPHCTGLWDDSHVQSWRKIVDVVKRNGAAIGVQLTHAGRKAGSVVPWEGDRQLTDEEGGWQTVAPSPLPFGLGLNRVPREMSSDDIIELKRRFVEAAMRADAAGFDVVEVQAGHGHLLNSFYSPLSNHRTDMYGGSLENRCRLVLDIAREVRGVWPAAKPLFFRISAVDWDDEGGFSLSDSIYLSQRLADMGVDLIDVTSGYNTPALCKTTGLSGYQIPFSHRIKSQANVMTAAVGRINRVDMAEDVIASGKADLVFIGRALIDDPHLPAHWAFQLGTPSPFPLYHKFWLKLH